MRLALLSDIHANLHALEAVLTSLRREGVDGYLCAGDLVGYGPYPNECVERIAELEAPCVAGNHDLIALGRLPDDQCIRLARESLQWTRERLRDDVRGYLEALPPRLELPGGIVMAHGSLDNPREYVRKPEQGAAQLAQLAGEYPGAAYLILGHTHQAWLFDVRGSRNPGRTELRLPERGPTLLNPGSVGQSRDRTARARCMVLDLERRTARLLSVPYDVRACREALRREGRPADSCHLRPSPIPGPVRRLYRAARRLLTVSR